MDPCGVVNDQIDPHTFGRYAAMKARYGMEP